MNKQISEESENASSDFKFEDLLEVNDSNLKILGKGSYGEVKLYRHAETGILYAVKTISKDFIRKHSSISVILREIRVHKELNHPNIIRLIKYFEDSEKVYIVLEYASKGSLFKIIRKQKGLDESKAWHYFSQTCLGMKYLHDNEIIHRDLKPENIIIDKNNQIKICDFGWCAQSNEVQKTFCGTMDYMAPEILLGEEHSFQVDLWSLGILLYELLHGYVPFRAVKDSEKRQQILNSELSFASGTSSLAKDLIQRLIKINPKDRINLNKILAHPWIAKFANTHDLEKGSLIKHPQFEIGEIIDISGLICKVKFRDLIVMVTIPDALDMKCVEEKPIVSISEIENEVFVRLEKWCKTPVANYKKLQDFHIPILDLSSLNHEKIIKKRKGSIDIFEEIVESSNYHIENGETHSPEMEHPEKLKQKHIINHEPSARSDHFGGIFVDNEYDVLQKKRLNKAKRFESRIKGNFRLPGENLTRNVFTVESTSFQSVFNFTSRIDISEEALDNKLAELNGYRRTLDLSNRDKTIKKREKSFWGSLFGCLDR
ncbi:hypothetical protein SteCoe_5348 [Stentor coeruleus]|uniref:Aurora kinase n=1 Tax=Stentor coeruleus TaxID=5963 RepID=A0A1R2CSS4_9CILI|nr:hypothetical protein SteCoe_5348 [Stentor coeruleus]